MLAASLAGDALSRQIYHGTRRSQPPVIDIWPIVNSKHSSEADQAMVQQQILEAAHDWGFFQVVNHGISPELQQNLTQQMALFFHSPQDVKYSIKRTENNSRGFADDELTKRLKDAKEILDIGQVRALYSIPKSNKADPVLLCTM